MTDVRDALLDFHAAHSRVQLMSDPAYDDLCKAHEGEHEFETLRDRIAELNDSLEGALRNAQSRVDQVMAALVTVRRVVRRPGKLELCRELVRRRYTGSWSQEQMAYFEAASVKLETWRDYFVSFTSYNPFAPGFNLVNVRHQELIGAGAGLPVERPDAVERNLLAQAVDTWLRGVSLRGFYWEKHSDPAAIVTTNLQEQAAASFIFLQILQSTLFQRDPNAHPNYCKLEYEAGNTDPSRVLVLLAEELEDLISKEDLDYEEFEEWYDGLRGRTHLALKPVHTQIEAADEWKRFGRFVKQQVEQAKQRLIAGAPA